MHKIPNSESETIEFKTSFNMETVETLAAFDNYITFYNPSKLYGDLTVEDLQTNTYQAATRNKLIAEAFYLTKDIEKYGSGFRRIRDEIKQYPTMKLECAEIPNGFLATISYTERKISQVTEKVGEKGTEKVGEKVGEKITENQQKIIKNIDEYPHISASELAVSVGISKRKIEKNLSKLKTKGLIERIGPDKGGYWKVVK